MIRVISLLGMAGGFLAISPPLRGSALKGLALAMLEMGKYSPYSYIALALALGFGAVRSMATPKAR
jgi:hypothetical protein